LSPQSTKYESFDDILISNNFIDNIKTFEKLIEFKDSFVKTGFYSKNFKEIKELGFGSFGSVFKVKRREDSDYYNYYRKKGTEYLAIKRIEFTSEIIDVINELVVNVPAKQIFERIIKTLYETLYKAQ
jgi:hypothetical protein